MTDEQIKSYILDSIPYPIVFADANHIIRYLNATAKHHYYTMRGYQDLVGKPLFDCHGEVPAQKIKSAVEKLKGHANQMFLHVTVDNYRLYLNPVRNKGGELIGYFGRYEMNLQK